MKKDKTKPEQQTEPKQERKLDVFKICAVAVTIVIVLTTGLITAIVTKGITVKFDSAVQTSGDDVETTEAPSDEETTAIENVTDENGEPVTDENGQAVTEVITEAPSDNNGGKQDAGTVDLSSPQKILDYYAKAIHYAAHDGKGLRAGMHVTRKATAVEAPDWGFLGNMKVKGEPAVDQINKFIGLSPYDETYEKGSSLNNRKVLDDSKLTVNDIKSASYKKSGNDYILTINVKDGNSACKNKNEADKGGGTNNSPIEKCGMCASNSDYHQVHHKNAINVVVTGSGLITNATEKSSNCVVTATIDGQTGKIKNIKIHFRTALELTFFGSNKKAISDIDVEYKDFKY